MRNRREHDPVCPGHVPGRTAHAEFRCKSCDLIESARADERAQANAGSVLYAHANGTHRSWCTDPTCSTGYDPRATEERP